MIHDKTPKLNKFQKENIKQRLMLDFYKELDKLDDAKEKFFEIFSYQIECLINKFDNKGILFYSIDIELPNYLEESNFWESVHEHVEDFISYIGANIELVEFCYFSLEIEGIFPKWQTQNEKNLNKFYSKKKKSYLRGIIGVRSLLGKNKFLLFQIKEYLFFSFFHIEVKELSSVSKVKECWNNVIRQKNFKFHRFVNYSDFHPMIYGGIADEELKFEDNSAFGQENLFISDTMNIVGIQKKNPTKKEKILYLINLYMNHNDLFFYEDLIFEKIKNSKISWQSNYNFMSMKSEMQLIFEKVKSYYPQQLSNFNFMDLLLSDFDSIFFKIKKINSLVPKIDIFDNVIEFRNGIYFFESKIFVNFSEFADSEYLKYKTFFYFNFDFDGSILIKKILTNLYYNFDKKNLKDILNDKN